MTPQQLEQIRRNLYAMHRCVETLLHFAASRTKADAERADTYVDSLAYHIAQMQAVMFDDEQWEARLREVISEIGLEGDNEISPLEQTFDETNRYDGIYVSFSALFTELKRVIALAPVPKMLQFHKAKRPAA